MELTTVIIFCTFILTCTTVILTVIRTMIDWKLYKGSDKYWKSWKKRSKNIRKKLLKEMSDEMLEYELEGRRKKKDNENIP